VPVRHVPSFTAERAGAPTKSALVSLTMSLSTFLGLAGQPGRLDGHGPIAAGLARRIAQDAAKEQPTWTAWRCVITDDVHGTVLGITDPISTPRHDPPPRLSRLTTAMEPVCVFPGCRTSARRCEIDHRIPYGRRHPEGGSGRTCSCNLQPLCKTHHQQKTAGALHVRAVPPTDGPLAPLGTLEWTLPSGVTCRSHPYVAGPAPIRTTGAGADPDVTAAVQHLADRQTRWDTWRDEHLGGRDPDDQLPDDDWAGDAWQRSRADAARARAEQRAHAEAEAAAAAAPAAPAAAPNVPPAGVHTDDEDCPF
jgi:hypothetical protein